MKQGSDGRRADPFKGFRKFAQKRENRRLQAAYDQSAFENQQKEIFRTLDLDYEQARQRLHQACADNPVLEDKSGSQHHHLFAALSLTRQPTRILEIGTYDGKNAALLSHLFPSASIETLDLPDDHPVFVTTYKRGTDQARLGFIDQRNKILAGCTNVTYRAIDSVALSVETPEPYDLIWVDGAHGYPVVAIDLANAVRLGRKGGLIACDDVWTDVDVSDAMYRSIASYQSLQALRDAGLIRFELIFKRLTKTANANPKRRKFIGVVTKI